MLLIALGAGFFDIPAPRLVVVVPEVEATGGDAKVLLTAAMVQGPNLSSYYVVDVSYLPIACSSSL